MSANDKVAATFHPGTGLSTRVEAAAGAMRNPKPNQIKYGEDLEEWVDRVMPAALAAADAVDRESGIHRVKVDDDAVYAVTLEIAKHHRLDPMTSKDRCTCGHVTPLGRFFSAHVARAALAALAGGQS